MGLNRLIYIFLFGGEDLKGSEAAEGWGDEGFEFGEKIYRMRGLIVTGLLLQS